MRRRQGYVPTLEGLPTLSLPSGVGPTTMDDPSNHPPADAYPTPTSDPFGDAIIAIDQAWAEVQAEFPDSDPYVFVPDVPTATAPADPYN